MWTLFDTVIKAFLDTIHHRRWDANTGKDEYSENTVLKIKWKHFCELNRLSWTRLDIF